jgi:transcriptional regulator with XRE-family HTH domain
MSYRDYIRKRREDPEYREAEKQQKPILDLADDIIHLRLERGWTQGELAKRVGTWQANISRLENGLANPTYRFLKRLSEVFGTDLTVRLRRQPIETRTSIAYLSSDEGYDELAQGVESSAAEQTIITGKIIRVETGVSEPR